MHQLPILMRLSEGHQSYFDGSLIKIYTMDDGKWQIFKALISWKQNCKTIVYRITSKIDYFSQKPVRFMNISEQAKVLTENVIIVHLKYTSSKVDMTVLESRYSLSEKIANFGGMFGIWAELTGFSLLGIINVCLIVLKLLLGRLKNWKTDCLSNSN